MFVILMLAAVIAAGYGFVTTSPTLAIMAWLWSGCLLALAKAYWREPPVEWVRPVQLRRFFSVKIFMLTLLVSATLTGLAVASRTSGTFSWVCFELGLFMLLGTAPVTMLAAWAITEAEWRPDTRPWKDRAYVSGQSWFSMAMAMIPTNTTLIILPLLM